MNFKHPRFYKFPYRYFINLFLFTLILLSAGCSTSHIPISYNCPKIELPIDPVDYTKTLTDISSPDEVIKAWVATAEGYKEWNTIVKEQLSHQ